MSTVATLLDSRPAVVTLRRACSRQGGRGGGGGTVVACRSVAGLYRVLAERMVDAIVLGLKAIEHADLSPLTDRFPAIPVVVYASFRSKHAERLLALRQSGVAGVVVEGVDDAVAGAMVDRHSLTGQRIVALRAGPRQLRLVDPLQLEVWTYLVHAGGSTLRIHDLAHERGVSREYLSRQFAAGGAPNLKRVIDLTRICCAAQLLANPGYGSGDVAALLGFASASHLSAMARRIANVSVGPLKKLGPSGVLSRFVRVGTRSRSSD